MILKNKQIEILNKATSYFGINQRNNKTVEELSELIKEIVKDRGNEKIRKLNIIDEISDCLVMIKNQMLINNILDEEVFDRIDFKINRLEIIMENEKEE